MGGTLAPTAAPGGIAGTGVTALFDDSAPPSLVQVSAHRAGAKVRAAAKAHREAPPPPPATFDAYNKKSSESGGVIAMMDTLMKDVKKEITEMEAEEKDAQADYEKFMADSASKRATDSKALTDKTAAKANMEADLEAAKSKQDATAKELM